MSFSAATAAWIAVGAAACAVAALLVALWIWLRVRRLRAAQSTLLGDGKSDLVDFAVSLQARIDDLHRAGDEVAAGRAVAGWWRGRGRCRSAASHPPPPAPPGPRGDPRRRGGGGRGRGEPTRP